MGVSAILSSEITQHGTAYALGLVATAVNVNVAVAVPIQIVTTVRLF
jgi:hypothetical protein